MTDSLESLPNFLGFFHYDEPQNQKNLLFSLVLMNHHRKRSRTFDFKLGIQRYKLSKLWTTRKIIRRKTHQRLFKLFNQFLPKKIAHSMALRISKPLRMVGCLASPKTNPALKHRFLALPVLISFYRFWFEQSTPPNAALEKLIKNLKPDLVLFPSNAINPVGNDLTRLQRKHNFKTLFLIDNWDNLSSKSIFINQPDYLTVWGEQSREHATNIHDIPPERVFLLGTPRFDHYFEAMKHPLESPYSCPYILYVGCQIPFDELGSLSILDESLENLYQQGLLSEPLKIVYRPHPWRLPRNCPDLLDPKRFKHVIVDEQLKTHYYQYNHKKDKNIFQPALEYYPRLLKNAQFVIGPLTTMLLEASLFQKRVLALAYDDGIHYTNPKNALRHYLHFEGITELPAMTFAHTQDMTRSHFSDLILKEQPVDWLLHKQKLDYYLFQDEQPYAERLKTLVHQISEAWPAE
ncbi:hypothetical protein [Vampirovibrio sp.]|uniref:hypothetical protein n=1 Tax=Vampirovibrio sp. TaxID=2717857 RepID=UPI0035931EC1